MIPVTTANKDVPRRARKQCDSQAIFSLPSERSERGGGPRWGPNRRSTVQRSASRPAFTLVELLVVITIIGMLAGMALGALYSAREMARVEKTKSTITKLDRIIQAKYAEFLTRRLPIANRRVPPDAMEELRVRVLHEIMRMEMPDRLTDITYPRVNTPIQPTDIDATFSVNARYRVGTGSSNNSVYVITEPALRRTALARRFFRKAVASNAFLNGPDPKYDSAECLYMIVAADPDAMGQFQENEIGDSDEDGFFEFHDGWDRPIMFLRWAPGFRSEVQTGDAERDHDPTDPRRIGEMIQQSDGNWERPTNTTMFRLVPLIYSAGPDGVYGINLSGQWVCQYEAGDVDREGIDHVWVYENSDGLKIGEPYPATHEEYDAQLDNITNHSLGMN